MAYDIPQTMKAVCLDDSGNALTVRNLPVPVPGKGEVLVRMAASPVNPSDLARMKYLTPTEKKQFIAGIEGSGTVVAHGGGLLPSLWMGRRVACSSTQISSGTWAEYMKTSAMACVPLPKGISDEQGSMLLVNPLTAAAFINIAKAGGHKAIINTASAGTLGKMVQLLAKKRGISLIQVVRNEKQKESIGTDNAQNILNSADPRFDINLRHAVKDLNATLAFDAVGGEMTRRLLLALPYGGSVIVYGNLSGEQPVVDHKSLVTDNKTVKGFYLVNWLKENGLVNTLKTILVARDMLNKHISVPVQARFDLDDANQALETYFSSMSRGKVLLVPGSL